MAATVLIDTDTFELLADDTPVGPRRRIEPAVLDALSARYADLERAADPAAEALAIGRDLYRWLDGDGGQLRRLIAQAARALLFTVHDPSPAPTAAARALLQAPWELLADAEGPLAANALLGFSPLRRLGPVGRAPAADDHRLGLAFMAASPPGVAELDFEAEETAILDAVGDTNLDLLVDETGEPRALGQHLTDVGGLPVLHLSAHGHHAWAEPHCPPRPVLLLEDGAFGAQPTDAAALLEALRPAPPRLLFLSACLSAAAPDRPGDPRAQLPPPGERREPEPPAAPTHTGPAPAHPLAAALVLAGLPAVLGWDGPVADRAATRFAAALYRALAHRQPLAAALADARRALLLADDPLLQRHWHLARLWLGRDADAAAALAAGRRKRSLLPARHIPKALLGKVVPVAPHHLFVGRRRELQHALRLLDGAHHGGLLITGMGRLGKSSLAARILNRHRDDLAQAVLHGPFHGGELLDALQQALQPYPAARALLRDGQSALRAARAQGPEAALAVLDDLLADLLGGPCAQRDADGPALLLVLDDFEQLLDAAPGARPVRAEHAGLVAGLLRAFDPQRTDSRLLITSRFPFRLADAGPDPAMGLARIELPGFSAAAERKLQLRQRQLAAAAAPPDLAERAAGLPRAARAARGNPGLLDLLGSGLLLSPAVPLPRAEAALAEMETYLAGGAAPRTESLRDLLEQIAVDTLLDLAGDAGRALLRALTLFTLPIPVTVAAALTEQIGGALQPLTDLALLEPGTDPLDPARPALGVSRLAAGRLPPLSATDTATIARLAIAPLLAAWGGPTGRRPGPAERLLCTLAIAAADSDTAAACGLGALQDLETENYQQAAATARALFALLDAAARPPTPRLLATAARVLAGDGDGAGADALLRRATDDGADPNPVEALHLAHERGKRLYQSGDLDGAEQTFREAIGHAEAAGDEQSVAVAQGQIADILQARGQLDEALRIRTDVQLPVFQRLGDLRSTAITQGKIADILQARGQLDEALRIRTDVQLPVFQRLGDLRSTAITQGQIADILQARGQLDEALRIRTDVQLPVFQRLGDLRETAITQGRIADILQARGQLDEALRIRAEEKLPVFQRLGDLRSTAITQGQIADILQARGQLDEALRIRTDEALPVFQRLGDLRSTAITQGQIADILQARGQLDEALRIRTDEELPVYQRLGDLRSTAITQGKIADIRFQQGDADGAIQVYREAVLPAKERLGDRRGLMVNRTMLAQMLWRRGAETDRSEARDLLCLARAEARAMRLPEAGQIEAILTQFGLDCAAPG